MRFSKYHGALNDFLIVESPMNPRLAVQLCDRHAGVGADGVAEVSLNPPRMRIYNPDGSQPEMCGNALRCVVKFLAPRLGSPPWRIQTDAGELTAWMAGEDVVIDMGPPRKPVEEVLIHIPPNRIAAGRVFRGHTTSMGNPHFVLSSDDPTNDAECFGRTLSVHPTFSEGCNISFVRWVSRTHVEAVVFERGAGLTMACGTGACAIAHVGRTLGHLQQEGEAIVQLPGGALGIAVSHEHAGHLLMRGPAVFVFDGDTEKHGLNPSR